jgi:hypothetical protein
MPPDRELNAVVDELFESSGQFSDHFRGKEAFFILVQWSPDVHLPECCDFFSSSPWQFGRRKHQKERPQLFEIVMIVIPRFRYLGNIVGCEARIIESLLESSRPDSMRRRAAWVGPRHPVSTAINGC